MPFPFPNLKYGYGRIHAILIEVIFRLCIINFLIQTLHAGLVILKRGIPQELFLTRLHVRSFLLAIPNTHERILRETITRFPELKNRFSLLRESIQLEKVNPVPHFNLPLETVIIL